MRIVVAPDKFKGSLTAVEVGRALAAGLTRGRGDVSTTVLPVADGGDGTVDAALSVGYRRVQVDAVGPTGEPLVATDDGPEGCRVGATWGTVWHGLLENDAYRRRFLADTYVLLAKTQACHWNATGPNFFGLHKLTEAQYGELVRHGRVLSWRP